MPSAGSEGTWKDAGSVGLVAWQLVFKASFGRFLKVFLRFLEVLGFRFWLFWFKGFLGFLKVFRFP